jgi:hypothetical protein
MGGFKDKMESFRFENMTPKQSELFLKCWEHNIYWGKTLLREYFVTNSGVKGYGLKFLLSYSINQTKKLIDKCKQDYDYDLVAMIKDVKDGKISVGPAPIRFIYRLLRQKK